MRDANPNPVAWETMLPVFSYQLVACNRKDSHDIVETLDPTRESSASVADGVRIHYTLLKGRNMDTLSVVEIVDETVKFYSEDVDRRASVSGTCQYTTHDDRHCAVGRCLTQEALIDDPDQHTDANVNGIWSTHEYLDRDLLPQYRGHPLEFWSGLQHLHDSEQLWDSNGLNVDGLEVADKLILDFA